MESTGIKTDFFFPPSKCFWGREKQAKAGELGLYPLLVTPLGTPSLVTQPYSQDLVGVI